MDREDAELVFHEYESLRDPRLDPELAAVRTAILVEDLFGVVLPDDALTADALADPSRWYRAGNEPRDVG